VATAAGEAVPLAPFSVNLIWFFPEPTGNSTKSFLEHAQVVLERELTVHCVLDNAECITLKTLMVMKLSCEGKLASFLGRRRRRRRGARRSPPRRCMSTPRRPVSWRT